MMKWKWGYAVRVDRNIGMEHRVPNKSNVHECIQPKEHTYDELIIYRHDFISFDN